MDCDVAPVNECHLLLGRPWQFDLDATHGGRSNNYSFMHKGVYYMLKPMPENAIKTEVFASVKQKQGAGGITSKLRMALLEEKENDARIPTPKAAASESKVNDADPNNSHVGFGSLSDSVKQQNINKDKIGINKNMNGYS